MTSVAGEPGCRTDNWRQLSWVAGDLWADLLCEVADDSSNPQELIVALCVASRLGGALAATQLALQELREHPQLKNPHRLIYLRSAYAIRKTAGSG